uniref:Secreted protein n=1 Tax=Anser brachyrhynchus TaxID=132585 RepID=A0A8B9CQ15_9AVES
MSLTLEVIASLVRARSLLTCVSAMSARSSASSSSCCTLRYFTRLELCDLGGCPLPPYPGFQLLDLLLAPLESNLLCFVQAHLQVLDGLLHVLLHPLQVCTCVLLLLQLLCHHGSLQGRGTDITLRPGSPARHRDSTEEP